MNNIVGSVILRHTPEEAYANANWGIDLDYNEILVIYTLAIHPEYFKKGIGRKIIEFVIHYSLDGLTFQMARLTHLPMRKTIKVGFEAQSLIGEGGMRYFTDIVLENKTLNDIRKGV